MPAAKRAVAINLGMQTVTMAVLEALPGGGMLLASFGKSELAPDPAADASRPGQLRIAVAELRAKLKIKESLCAVAVPSQGVFTRFVKIPKVADEQVGKMLFFEAQQNVPYPIDEVSWCYQVLPDGEENKLSAIILATKLEELESSVDAVRGAGFFPSSIETSPTALYNALRYNYPDLDGCILLIDIGARATNLLFVEGEKLFVRTLPVGGNSITAALHKKYEGRSLAEVEETKVREAFIPPPGNHDVSAGESAEVGTVARTVMTRIHNEVTRSITFYRTNQQGSAPIRVLLAGGGASMPYTLEFFNEKLSLPIEFFNPLRRVPVAASVGDDVARKSAHALGECVGLASRLLLEDTPLEIRLESRALQTAARAKQSKPFLIAVVGVLAAVLGLFYAHFRTAADRLFVLNASLDQQIGKMQGFQQQLENLSAQRKQLFDKSADIAAAPMLRTVWTSILGELSAKLPERSIWITRLQPVSGEMAIPMGKGAAGAVDREAPANKTEEFVTALSIKGLYLENKDGPGVVDRFVDNLCQSELFQISADKKADIVKMRAAQTGENWAYDYELFLPLRRPIPL